MSVKKIYSINFMNKQLFIYKFVILLFFLITKFTFILSEGNSGINAPYPNVFQLHNNNLFLSNIEGMFFCDQNLQPSKFHHYYNKTIYEFKDVKDKILIAQFEEVYNIICLVQDVFYFFKENGDFILMGELPNTINQSPTINLLTYKKDEDNNFHFIIAFIDDGINNLFFYHYMINDNSYRIISNYIYSPFYFDYPNIHLNNKYFACQILESLEKGNILTCCFNTFSTNLIVLQSFEIDNNFTEIEEYYAKTPIDNINIMTSTRTVDKKYILVCYASKYHFGYCFNYNFDSNQIQNNKALIEACSDQINKFKVSYYKEKKEYIFICENEGKYTIIFFDKDLNLLNPNEITTSNYELPYPFYSPNSVSVIYDTNEEKYEIIADPLNITYLYSVTRKFIITTNFSQNFSSIIEKPNEFEEIPQDQELVITESNKYYVYTNSYYTVAKSDKDKKMYIDFMDEENLFIRSKTNKTIDPTLYSFRIELKSFNGNLTAEIDGIETQLENITYLTNITHLYFYPFFGKKGYLFAFNFVLYLTNKTIASEPAQYIIYVCQENCSCIVNNLYCSECLDNFSLYNNPEICINNKELKSVYFNTDTNYYMDCYKKCKTCSGSGFSDYDMNCLSCFEEYGDYYDNTTKRCFEKYCENLYYRDKNTNMKTCINESVCPEEYPYFISETKQCMHELTEDSTILSISSTQPFIPITQSYSSNNKNLSNTSTISFDSNLVSNEILKSEKSLKEDETQYSTKFEEIQYSTKFEEIQYSTKFEEVQYSTKFEEVQYSTKFEEVQYSTKFEETQIISKLTEIDEEIIYQKIIDLINDLIDKENIDEINKTYSILSESIKKGNISSFKKDITIKGENITYQITTTESQKKENYSSNVSVIHLGECEKIIKRNISYEDEPTPLIILKIDVKKSKTKSTAVEYEVYNPYTREKIDLSICSNKTISIYAPVSLDEQENALYDDLSSQGYDLFDVNNSFYIDTCATYTSSNGTDVSLLDRKDYYYNEDIVLCENNCKYINVDTKTGKVFCRCKIKNEVNVENDQEFRPQKLIENFYKVDTILNFEVLFCYKLVFSAKGLKKNICFYILIIFFVLFLISMIVNLFTAMKKIDEIIFKIFQDKFMYYFMQRIIKEGRKKRNALVNNDLIPKNSKEENTKPKLNWLQRLKLARDKNLNESSSNSINNSFLRNNKRLNNNKDNGIKNIEIYKHKSKKKEKKNSKLIRTSIHKDIKNNEKMKLKENKHIGKFNHNKAIENNETSIENDENNIINENTIKKDSHHKDNKKVNSININIINNIMNNHHPPVKKKNISNSEANSEEKIQVKNEASKKQKKRKSKKSQKINPKEISNSLLSNSISLIKLKKTKNRYERRKNLVELNQLKSQERSKNSKEKKNLENKKIKENQIRLQPKPKNIKYIDEELNRMDYEDALEYDKRTYWQYYWSLLKKKHIIVLTFVSIEDYNVFTLKFSLFILSLALYFAINTLFFKDSTMHQIFTEKGRYNLIYQIPQVLYSTLISFVMTFILKKLSLSQNELIIIKKEMDQAKAKKLAEESKKYLRIKLYSFFFLGLSLLLFFTYYISSFSAVYHNTQTHLLKDTLLSFILSMSYPFIINLFPGIFRIYSLNDGKKDKECFYKTADILALL